MSNNTRPKDYLSLLDLTASFFTFQTFGEGNEEGNQALIHVLHGLLPGLFDELARLNQQGAGIFVTVNETDGKGRKAENITRVRAIWQDDDEGYDAGFPLPPSLVVSTSPGKFQRLWLADGLSREEFKGLMRTMVDDYGSDKFAAGISRVLRLPGFYHTKAEPYLVTIVEASGKRYTRKELLKAFPPPKEPPPQPRAFHSTSSGRLNADETYLIRRALKLIHPDPYDKWLQVGMILHGVYGGDGEGLCLWMNWASESLKFDEKEHRYKWSSFGKTEGRKLGLGTLFRFADEALYGT